MKTTKKMRIIPSRGDYCVMAGDLDELGVVKIQPIGCRNKNSTNENEAPKYSDAEINYAIARLELAKEKVYAKLDEIIKELKSTL
jgi:hypothetical protein